ncbi:MAG: bifunctional phosphoglucose/phosphomannose isomerase [Omnitrophica bacterium]|nr:bifunctional phosphoglucose/phosphomannose isomerase [Candidatus Omnitrophota bacterium]
MKNLNDIKGIEATDQQNMRSVLADFPKHCQEAFQLGKKISLPLDFAKVKNILFSGMGGSAIGAEIVSSYLRKEVKVPIGLNRDYSLPEFVNKETLAILISYSGNTEETLSAYEEAFEKRAKIVILTSGGKLADLAKKRGHPYIIVPSGFPPRVALAFVSFPTLAFFSQMHLIQDKQNQIDEISTLLEKLKQKSLGLAVEKESNPAKALAERLFDNFCVIYGSSEHLSAVVTRWRGQLAENSKILSSSHLLPEMNHNEIVGWQHPKEILEKFVAVFLRDKQDHPQVQKRIEINKEILQKEGVRLEEVWSQGEGLLARIFSLIYLGDFLSYYLAVLNGEDPTPVKRIDYLKRRLKELK